MINRIDKYHIMLIFGFIFIAFTGATSLNPILPSFILQNNQTGLSESVLYGILAAVFPLGQFMSAYALPYFARQYSYRSIIKITSVLSVATTFFLSTALLKQNIVFVIIFRFICGCLEGNVVLTREIIIKLTDEKNMQKKYLGIVSSAITLGFLVGPVLNGYLYHLNETLSLFFPTAMVLLMALIAFLLPYDNFVSVPDEQQTIPASNHIKIKNIWLISLTMFFAADLFYQYIPYYLVTTYNFNVQQIAFDLFIIAIANAITAPFSYLPTQYCGYKNIFSICSLLFICNTAALTMVTSHLIPILLFFHGMLIALLSNNIIYFFTDTPQKKNNYMMSHIVSARVIVSATSAFIAGQIAVTNLKFPLYLSISFICLFLTSLRYQWKS